ncbi:MAG TPA: TlpA disulfide reductase family protein [Solirubrobacteraceae bacterium]|nr:TlpA disulfide reductase family protein [Solirubrobacteraceae bacterium]
MAISRVVIARPHRARVAVAAAAALALAGCGSAAPRSAAPSAAQERSALAGSPEPLSALHRQADQLLTGGRAAFGARLRALHGYPVVVNKWAQWCAPCRSEFPVYQRVSVTLGRQVAFLGLDGKDFAGPAAGFLRRFPVSYPSYQDHDEAIARSLQASTFYPETIFLDRSGHQVFVHAGPYTSPAALTRDIRFYVLR